MKHEPLPPIMKCITGECVSCAIATVGCMRKEVLDTIRAADKVKMEKSDFRFVDYATKIQTKTNNNDVKELYDQLKEVARMYSFEYVSTRPIVIKVTERATA